MKNAFVVTGATSGIGAAVTELLASRGCDVIAVARRGSVLASKWSKYGNVHIFAADLATDLGCGFLTSVLESERVIVKSFVHCAGIDFPAPLRLTGVKTMRDLFEIHAVFPMRFLGWMSAKNHHAKDAKAVLVSSQACHEECAGHVAYAAAKGAVEGMMKSLKAEMSLSGIDVNCIVLGPVDTPMTRFWYDKLPVERRAQISLRNAGDVAREIACAAC